VPRRHLLDLDPAELSAELTRYGEPSFRAGQVYAAVLQRGAASCAEITGLPAPLRQRLDATFSVFAAEEVARTEAPDGTSKLLLRWPDGASTETVMIPAEDGGRPRRTVCLSTQVGCDVGCRFCASGIGGAVRDLTVGEVLEQALRVDRLLRQRSESLTHVVFMGMGEPLANYEVTVEALRRLNAPWSLGIGQRRITVSTVGLPKQIERFADEGLQATLALSLHAPNDELRAELIPWAKGISLDKVLPACRTYFERTGREVTLEYCLLAGVNDSDAHAGELAAIALDLRAHVNLMVYNPVPELPFRRPSRNRAIAFLKRLRARGARAHLRESRGLEADAACGQLRRRTVVSEPTPSVRP
jgi:23S rRNA (adenine2503-C2)-methyltransferase